MKKIICLVIFIVLLVVIDKYCTSNYTKKYEVNNFSVSTTFKNDRFYFEIDGNKDFNFDIYEKRRVGKKLIKSIDIFESNGYYCVYPFIKDIDTYPLCYKEKEHVDYHFVEDDRFNMFYKVPAIEDKIIYEEPNTFKFYNNLDKNTYIALWKYDGFYLMNNEKQEKINLFKKGQYDNSLYAIINSYLLIPNYDQEHIFNEFVLFNFKNKNKEIIKGKFDIDYDSYIVGVFKNNVYLFDNKNLNLYEINIKKKEISLIGDEKSGYVKFENGKFIEANKNEYKKEKITYFNKEQSNYNYDIENNKLYKSFKENKEIKTLIFEGNNIKIVNEFKDKLYFISDETFYEYNPIEGAKPIFYYFEFNFNDSNVIFIYNQ